MRAMGVILLTGTLAIVAWKLLAALVFGLVGMILKVGVVILVVYLVLRFLESKKDE